MLEKKFIKQSEYSAVAVKSALKTIIISDIEHEAVAVGFYNGFFGGNKAYTGGDADFVLLHATDHTADARSFRYISDLSARIQATAFHELNIKIICCIELYRSLRRDSCG